MSTWNDVPSTPPVTPANQKPPRKRWPWSARITVIVLAVFALVGLGSLNEGGGPTATTVDAQSKAPTRTIEVEVPGPTKTVEVEVPGPTVTVTAKPPAPKPAVKKVAPKPAKVTIGGEGMYLVGDEVKPGRYKTTGPSDAAFPNCYWERLAGTSGDFEDILANENLEGPGFVTIKKSDEAFSTSGCADWTLVK